MKRILSIGVLTIVIAFMQACSPNWMSSKSRDAAAAERATETLRADKRAKLETQRAVTAERRRIEFDERYRKTPYYTNTDGNVVYNKSEVAPAYYGGEEALAAYLRNHLVYPTEARNQGLEGTIFVDFVVLSNGHVNEVYVMEVPGEIISQSLREEAVRVIVNMPNWIPGRQNGEAVDVRYSLPITFRIG
jgi:TonB family protein